ncbi:AbrB family transcriptional regulator [Shimia abyssi]|nr:AbrB family transcriptional regulator [Shimia abyssi]
MTGYSSAAACFVAGVVGALGFWSIGGPLPFLIGSLLGVAIFSIWLSSSWGVTPEFPALLRKGGVALVGAMIGSSLSDAGLSDVSGLTVSFLAVLPLMLVMHGVGYGLLRKLNRFDRTTAFFASLPGGIVDAAVLGEQAGGDVARISLQHLVRILLVVLTIPLLLSVWSGVPVVAIPEASTTAPPSAGLIDGAILAVLAAAGVFLGQLLRLPAAHLIGPVLIAVLVSLSGIMPLTQPSGLMAAAQLVVGASLGVRYAGIRVAEFLRSAMIGALILVLTLTIAALAAWFLHSYSPMGFETLLLSFAPGGLAELSLVAWSFGFSPILVSAHHILRIGGALAWATLVGWSGVLSQKEVKH